MRGEGAFREEIRFGLVMAVLIKRSSFPITPIFYHCYYYDYVIILL